MQPPIRVKSARYLVLPGDTEGRNPAPTWGLKRGECGESPPCIERAFIFESPTPADRHPAPACYSTHRKRRQGELDSSLPLPRRATLESRPGRFRLQPVDTRRKPGFDSSKWLN